MSDPFKSLSTPVHRASTVLFADAESFARRRERRYDGYTYGLYGTPTSEALAGRIAGLEGAAHAVLAPSGLAAVTLVNFALLRAGDHALFSDAMYGPTRDAAAGLLGALGVQVQFYDPLAGEGIAALFKPATRLVWVESPGTLTMEMQDLPAIAGAARARGIAVAADNSWATPLRCRALALGADFSVQALTKFVGGHADLLLGSVAVREEKWFRRLRDVQGLLGIGAAPDECFLALRGLETLELRLERQCAVARQLAQWLAAQQGVERVLHPALPGDPGHALWARDMPGAGAVFSFALADPAWEAARRFTDALERFRIGASWGGVHSLVAAYPSAPARAVRPAPRAGALLRLAVGLEPVQLLQDDIAAALAAASPSR